MNILRTLRTLWAAILASSLLTAALHFIVPPPLHTSAARVMPFALGVVAAALAVVSFVMPRNFVRIGIRNAALPITEELDPDAQADYRAHQPMRKVVRVDDALLTRICGRYMTPLILSIALSESISLFGLVLDRLAFPTSQTAPFFIAGTLLIVARVPTKRRIFAAVERAIGVPLVDAG